MTDVLLTVIAITFWSAVLVVVVRRWIEPVPWRIAGLLLVFVFVFAGRGIFTTAVPVPLDEVMRGYPYHGIYRVDRAKNYLTNDLAKQILPWMAVVREQFARGRAPLWNPYQFSGYPLLGNAQAAPFSPFFLSTLFVPLPKQIVAIAGLKLFVALLFGYMLLRREKVSEAAALFGAVAFAFAVFSNVFLYYPLTAVTLLLPAAVYSTLWCLRERRGAPIVLLAITTAALFAGGDPEALVHVATAVVVMVAIEGITPQWAQGRFGAGDIVRAAGAAAVGAVIAAPAWIPVLRQLPISAVMSSSNAAAHLEFPATALWAMLNPDGFGNPAHGNYSWIHSYVHVATLYVGLIVTALLPAEVFSPRAQVRDRLLVVVAVVFVIFSLHWTYAASALDSVRGISWLAEDRVRVIALFMACIAASKAVSRLRNWDLILILGAAAIILPLSGYVFVKMYGRTLTVWSAAGIAALVIFCAIAVARRNLAAPAALVLTSIELLVFTFDYNAPTDRRYYAPQLPIVDALRRYAAAAPPEPFRILGLDWALLPNGASQYGLEDVRGSDPMGWDDYARFFSVVAAPGSSGDVKRIVDPNQPAIDFLNVRYLLTDPHANLGGKWQRLYSGPDGELYENANFIGRFYVPGLLRRVRRDNWQSELARTPDFQETPLAYGKDLPPAVVNPADATITCQVHGPSEFRLRVSVPSPALVASSEPALPAWRVRVNGDRVPIVRINGAFLGFWVPAGSSDVGIKYRDLVYRESVGAAFLGLLLLGGWARLVRQRVE